MIKILIYEDDREDLLNLIACIDSFFQSKEIKYEIEMCDNKEKLMSLVYHYDLLFLDIELGNENGIEIGLELRERDFDCRIILTTHYAKYAIDGYKIQADRYFLKPITQNEFNTEMGSIVAKYYKQLLGFYDSKISLKKIYYADILYVEFINRKTYLHFFNKVLETPYSLKYWLQKLDEQSFSQSHKSFIVNLDSISGFVKQDIILMNEELIPLSRNYKKNFFEKYDMNLHYIL